MQLISVQIPRNSVHPRLAFGALHWEQEQPSRVAVEVVQPLLALQAQVAAVQLVAVVVVEAEVPPLSELLLQEPVVEAELEQPPLPVFQQGWVNRKIRKIARPVPLVFCKTDKSLVRQAQPLLVAAVVELPRVEAVAVAQQVLVAAEAVAALQLSEEPVVEAEVAVEIELHPLEYPRPLRDLFLNRVQAIRHAAK